MRLTRVVFCIGLAFLAANAKAQNPLEDNALKDKIRPSLVKIEIVFRDARKRSIGNPVLGQGLRISSSGHILTAAHVVIPSTIQFRERNAAAYELRISAFSEGDDSEGMGYKPLVVDLPKDIRQDALYDQGINTSIAPCATYSTQPCAIEDINADRDFIIIRSRIPTDKFIDLVGPYDLESSFSAGNVGVISDFSEAGSPQYVAITPTEIEKINMDTDVARFEASDRDIFYPGTSGSPIIAWRTSSRKGVVALGIVTSNFLKDRIKNKFSGTLVGQTFAATVLPGLLNDASFIAQSDKSWDCKHPFSDFPGPNSILRDFLLITKDGPKKFRKTMKCGRDLLGWEISITHIDYVFDGTRDTLIRRLANKPNTNECQFNPECLVGTRAEVDGPNNNNTEQVLKASLPALPKNTSEMDEPRGML